MSTCVSFGVQVTSIMEVLTKTAVAEIIKLVDDGSAALRLEMCRSQRENETLKRKLLLMERELIAVRGYGERTLDNSLDISFEVELCDEFGETRRPNANVTGRGSIPVVESVFDERLSAGLAEDDQRTLVVKNKVAPDALDIKPEPVDVEEDWPESLLPSKDRLEEDLESSQSQLERNISEENSGGIQGVNDGEGPHCEEGVLHMLPCPAGDPEKGLQAELKQEPEGEPLIHTLPLLGSTEGLELQCVWGKAQGSGAGWEKRRELSGSSEPGDARIYEDFSPLQYRGSRRLRLENDMEEVPGCGQDDGSSQEISKKRREDFTAMHPSIIKTGSQLKSTEYGGSRFGCPLCPKFITKSLPTVQRHLDAHIKNAVHFHDVIICRCNLQCRYTGHHHCPYCTKTIMRKEDMALHVIGCQTLMMPKPHSEPYPPLSAPSIAAQGMIGSFANCFPDYHQIPGGPRTNPVLS